MSNLTKILDEMKTQAGVSESESSKEDVDAALMFLKDTARDAKLALDMMTARSKAGKTLYGFSDLVPLRDAANTMHNTVGWLKSHR